MRRLLFIASALLALVAAGCPLTIQVRCDESFPCNDGEACVAGACVRVEWESAQVGAACTSDAACGAGLTCGTGFPGGYCLAPCGEGGSCASGSVCVKELGRCMRACGEACSRPGYACRPVPQPGSSTWACAPTSSNGGDGGTVDPGPSDAGCTGQVPLNERCAQACDCATPGADCVDSVCVRTCTRDSDCPDGSRCNEGWNQCEKGPRLGEACRDSFDCQGSATCNAQHRCTTTCKTDWSCPLDYRCAPDSVCVNECTTSAPPETVGLTCESSMDCARCGFCVASGAVKQCRQPCQLDRDCPGGAVGACEQVGSTALRACRLP